MALGRKDSMLGGLLGRLRNGEMRLQGAPRNLTHARPSIFMVGGVWILSNSGRIVFNGT